ncbi:hypothetical protein POPTR_001G302801v4 [Populus trichocarpa]|uniref:Uncharacterized protein n=2 Tax=Populus trichocarpa TaxID=3694 RepID=A0ACC0TMR1_POPTR|nr:hypothetical protein POPTR_001G302801v4 [Populus trichocarpa]KAI9402654.1 hypothetical protein POPTR_001G302801v4 [Populus trichocarpa]
MDQDHTSQRATCNGFLRRRGADKTYGIKLVRAFCFLFQL